MIPHPQHPRDLTVRWTDLMDLLSEGNMCSRQDIIDRIKDYNDICQCRFSYSSHKASTPAPAAPAQNSELRANDQISSYVHLKTMADHTGVSVIEMMDILFEKSKQHDATIHNQTLKSFYDAIKKASDIENECIVMDDVDIIYEFLHK